MLITSIPWREMVHSQGLCTSEGRKGSLRPCAGSVVSQLVSRPEAMGVRTEMNAAHSATSQQVP